MNSISHFLETAYKKIKNRGVDQKIILENIKQITNISLKKENLEIKGGDLYLKNVNSSIRSEMFFYKNKIIATCRVAGVMINNIH